MSHEPTNDSIDTAGVSRRGFLQLGALSLGGAAILGVAGCGESSGSSGSSSTTLKAAFERPLISLDPHGTSDVDEATLLACRHIYDALVTRQGDKTMPSVATKWEQPDPSTWVFHLRDVKFHDGTDLTASDVKASLERIAASDTAQAALWTSLDSVEATDAKTVTIHTKGPLGTMLTNLSLLFIAPASKLKNPSFFNHPIGSGPFKVSSYTASDHLNLVAASDYWGPAPKLKNLQLPYIPETSTRLTSLKTGEVDVTWSIPSDQMDAMSHASGVKVESTPGFTYYFNWFNCSRKPFTDARVRQAMWHAIDVPTVVSNLYGSTAQLMKAPIPSTVFGYAPQQPYDYNPGKARSLLGAAGYPNGFSTTLMWSTGIAPNIRSLAEAFQSYWAKIGVKVSLQELEQAAWLDRLDALKWDMDLQNNTTTTGDADFTLGRLYTSDANRMGYKNPALDKILADARSSTDQSHRQQLYAQACKTIWDDAVGIFPLQVNNTFGITDSVKGFVPAQNNQPMFTNVTA